MASESINSPFGRYWLRPHSGSRNNCEIFCLAHWNCISVSVHVIFYIEVLLAFMFIFETENRIKLTVYKSGTGTRGRGHRDACAGTWDLGTQDEGLEDIKYGTRGRVGRGRGDVKYRDAGDAGCEWLSQKSEVNAISLSSWKCVIYDSIFQNHIGHLMMFTQNISLK